MTVNRPTTNFEVVPRAEVPAPKRGGRPPSPLSLALERGDTVFLAGRRAPYPAPYLNARGFSVRYRRGDRNGVSGIYLWAEKVETDL